MPHSAPAPWAFQLLAEMVLNYFWCDSFTSTSSAILFFSSKGSWDMYRAYRDMREANYIGADKYFHARGNYDAARRGPGGAWAAKVIR